MINEPLISQTLQTLVESSCKIFKYVFVLLKVAEFHVEYDHVRAACWSVRANWMLWTLNSWSQIMLRLYICPLSYSCHFHCVVCKMSVTLALSEKYDSNAHTSQNTEYCYNCLQCLLPVFTS